MPFIILLFFSVLIAVYASCQGRSFLLWFLVSAIFTPLIGLIALLIVIKYSTLQKIQNVDRVVKTIHYPK